MPTPESSEQDVMEYIEAHCGTLWERYGGATFNGIDGEAFMGLTPATIAMVLPQLTPRDTGLLLAKIETVRRQHADRLKYWDLRGEALIETVKRSRQDGYAIKDHAMPDENTAALVMRSSEVETALKSILEYVVEGMRYEFAALPWQVLDAGWMQDPVIDELTGSDVSS